MNQERKSSRPKPKQKWKIPILITASALVVAAPMAVASFVEDPDLTQITNQTMEEVFNINNGTWVNPGIDVVGQISEIASGSFEVNDILKTVLGKIKGVLGLPDPTEVEPEVETGDVESQPTDEGHELAMRQIKTILYPEQAYTRQGHTESMSTAQVQAYIASVLGKDGQQSLANQINQSQSYAETAQSGLQHMAQLSGAAQKESQTATTAAASGQAIAQRAQGRKMSQEVLKDNTALLAEMGKIDAAQSNQLSLLSNQASIQSGQITGISGQMGIGNQLLAQLRVGQAYQTIETTNISQAIAQLNEAERDDSRRTLTAVSRSIDMYNVPGFASLSQQGKL